MATTPPATSTTGTTATGASARRARVRAPELRGRRWLNTGGRDLTLAGLRGKLVLLDFWTSCCVNCLHVLDELRDVEERFADVLVTVGVHSPKFRHEAEPAALDAAVERYAVHHPVLDDPELVTWRAYAARAWPTLVVVDPEGYVVAQLSGEGHAPGLAVLLAELVAEHEAKGTLHRGAGPYVAPERVESLLRFPSRVLPLPSGTFLVADTAHHRLVELDADLTAPVRCIGSGRRGFTDGDAATASFAEPQGFCLLPAEVAARTGYDVVVADTVNHALRGVRLADGSVVTVAGTGRQLRRREGGGPALEQDLSSPWDVEWFDGQVVVAMAGTHQLWAFDPAGAATATTTAGPARGVVRVLAGTTAEGLHDGAAEQAWFAQTSGLVAGPGPGGAGERLWFVDAETSALRWLQRSGGEPDRGVPAVTDERMANVAAVAGAGYEVGTAVGLGLFDFGFRDGPGSADDGAGPGGAGEDVALLQHPLGLALAPDGSVVVADTYNGAVRRYDPADGRVTTLLRDLAEPSDVLADDDGLLVVEAAAHRVSRFPLPPQVRVDGAAHRVQRPATDLPPGEVELLVRFVPPTGQKLDDRWGDPTRLLVDASPPELLTEGAGEGQGLRRVLRIAPDVPGGVLHVSVQAAACDGDPVTGEVPEFAACHLYQQDWGIPVRVRAGAPAVLDLDLRGL
ncbi:thiol-disulfide isomerase/thioredoxin [Kineococcus xinjiangensis]|uniref:Thiol-disulfide isomerase/thioredoxin n=1 Tax=Kineococcus xinjiangensis TaxID=512762 RepID=A0A2S6IVJ8_9ACTN|nr:NHL domain-containing thioredoxin family protein [Kineococcus xinjiangensis]PPK98084.1 thiol-disulfide isomerase/thioredoxin [Kineococcus xinjiangensis]